MKVRIYRIFYFVVYWLVLALAIQGTVRNVRAVEQSNTLSVEPIPETKLQVTATMVEESAILGERAHFVVNVSNESEQEIHGGVLRLPGHNDVGSWQANGRSLSNSSIQIGDIAAYTTHRLELSAQVQGLSPHPIPLRFEVEAENVRGVDTGVNLITTSLPAETVAVTESETLSFAQERLQVDVSQLVADKQPVEFVFQLQEQHFLQAHESGVILAFQLDTRQEIDESAEKTEETTIQLTIGDLVTSDHLTSDRLSLYARPIGEESWTNVEMTIDTNSGIISFASGGFGEYLLTENPEPWKLTYTPPGASEFSGAGQYSYGINLPPGAGGLMPSLSLNYNSRGVDSMRAQIMGRGVGAGWSMPSAEITNKNAYAFYQSDPEQPYAVCDM
jgi:hypothetical protein